MEIEVSPINWRSIQNFTGYDAFLENASIKIHDGDIYQDRNMMWQQHDRWIFVQLRLVEHFDNPQSS